MIEKPKGVLNLQGWLMLAVALVGMFLAQFVAPQNAALQKHVEWCERQNELNGNRFLSNRDYIMRNDARLAEVERRLNELERIERRRSSR